MPRTPLLGAVRRVGNEPALLTALSEAIGTVPGAGFELRLLSDAPPTPLADAAALLSRSAAVVGVHGAGWANLVFVGERTRACARIEPATAAPRHTRRRSAPHGG